MKLFEKKVSELAKELLKPTVEQCLHRERIAMQSDTKQNRVKVDYVIDEKQPDATKEFLTEFNIFSLVGKWFGKLIFCYGKSN